MGETTTERVEVEERLVDMGICKSCKEPWSMPSSEMLFYKKVQGELGKDNFNIPKNCRSCREKRKSRDAAIEKFTKICGRLDWLEKEAEKGHFTFEQDELAKNINETKKEVIEFGRLFKIYEREIKISKDQHAETG